MADESKKIEPAEQLISTTQIAGVLGLTARRVQQLSQDNILLPKQRGKYGLGDSVQRYITYLQGRQKQTNSDGDEARKLKAEADLKEHKAKIERLRAEEAEGKMHRAEDVRDMTEDLLLAVRSALLSLPGRLAVDVSDAGTAAEAAELIKREVSAVMKEIASYRYDPAKYAERTMNRLNMEIYAEEEA